MKRRTITCVWKGTNDTAGEGACRKRNHPEAVTTCHNLSLNLECKTSPEISNHNQENRSLLGENKSTKEKTSNGSDVSSITGMNYKMNFIKYSFLFLWTSIQYYKNKILFLSDSSEKDNIKQLHTSKISDSSISNKSSARTAKSLTNCLDHSKYCGLVHHFKMCHKEKYKIQCCKSCMKSSWRGGKIR